MRRALIAVVLTAGLITVRGDGARAQGGQIHDTYYFICEINKASIVMLAENGIVPEPLAARIAKGIQETIVSLSAKRPTDYFDFEPKLLEVAGPEASRVHTGRSRQDIESTYQRQYARESLLKGYEALNDARGRLLALADNHLETIIPAYTLDVQAQPTSLAHYLHGIAATLERDSERLRAAYARINCSPLGAAALGTSGFPLDRRRLADLLGFEGVVENSYDANHMAPVDFAAELVSTLAISALHLGQFSQDLLIQYHNPTPWLMLKEGALTGTSSIMPQKRNPRALGDLRAVSSAVVGDAQTVFVIAHNTSVGDYDYREEQQFVQTAEKARRMYRTFSEVLDGLIVYPDRSLAEVNAEYSTMTELADMLLREALVPFRIGHHFASELTNYGRAHGLTPKEIPYQEGVRIYREVTGEKLPLTEAQFRSAFDAKLMVTSRRGLGGPQPAEVKRMLAESHTRLASDGAWLQARRQHLQDAQATLDKAFSQLIARSPTEKQKQTGSQD